MTTADSKKILVAKDSLFFKAVLKNTLAEAGHEVMLVESGSEVINAIKTGSGNIDLLMLDFFMPDMDAFGVLKWISENNSGKFPIFVITEEHELNLIIENLIKYGASAVISKSLTPGQIIYRINKALFPEKCGELRYSIRIPISVPVDFMSGSVKKTGYLLNISKSGAFLHTEAILDKGTTIGFEFSLPGIDSVLGVEGAVRWCTKEVGRKSLFGGYGVQFETISRKDQEELNYYVNAEFSKLNATPRAF